MHLMTFAKTIHSQKKTVRTLESIIACKRVEISTLAGKLQSRKRKILDLEDKEERDERMRKRVKLSDLMHDLDSQLEEATKMLIITKVMLILWRKGYLISRRRSLP